MPLLSEITLTYRCVSYQLALSCINVCLNIDQAIKLFGAIFVNLIYYNICNAKLFFHTWSAFVIKPSLLPTNSYIVFDLLIFGVISTARLVVLIRLIFQRFKMIHLEVNSHDLVIRKV